MPGKINQWGSLGCVSSNHVFSILLLLPLHQEVNDLLVNAGYLALILYLNIAERGGEEVYSVQCEFALNMLMCFPQTMFCPRVLPSNRLTLYSELMYTCLLAHFQLFLYVFSGCMFILSMLFALCFYIFFQRFSSQIVFIIVSRSTSKPEKDQFFALLGKEYVHSLFLYFFTYLNNLKLFVGTSLT